MGVFEIVLILAAFLCSLAAGLLFAFAVVIMPGIARLNDREFLRAFQVIDRVIQDNQPLFILVWIGSVLALVISAVLGFAQLDGVGRLLIVTTVLIYLLGVQLPTITINVPLNNQLQSLDVDTMNETALSAAREAFEPRWNRSNAIRTALACLASLLLMVLLLIL